MPISPDSLLADLRWRYATKQFDPAAKIATDTWQAIEESLVLTPSSFGLQPWKFWVIDDPELRQKLAAQSWNQPQVIEASHLVVLTARADLEQHDIDQWIQRLGQVQGTPEAALAPLKKMIVGFSGAMTPEQRHDWNRRQVYLALGQLMAAAAVMGIDSCPLEGIHAPGYDELLGLPNTGYRTAVACALGYRLATDKYAAAPKARFEKSQMIAHL